MKRLLFVLGSACLLAAPVGAQSGRAAATAPTFNKDVAPIIFANCIGCHRPGEIAPMSLLTYQDARPWAKGIKAKVTAHEMPPWFADPRYGKFRNVRGLTDAQIDTLVAWVDAGAPQGTGPAPVAQNVINDSQAGTLPGMPTRPPDAIIEAPVEMFIPAAGGNITGNDLWGKPPFTEDKYITAAELRPSNRAVTHHSQVGALPLPKGAHHIGLGPAYVGGPLVNAIPVTEDGSSLNLPVSGEGAQTEEATANVENFSLATRLLFYGPGAGTTTYAPGLVKVFHRDDYSSWNIHYNATGRPEKDRHTLRLWFATETPTHEIKSGTVNQVNITEHKELVGKNVKRENVPAYAENYRVASLWALPYDATLNSLWPHMHLRGKDMTFYVTYPDGREEILLSVPKYTFNWQVNYQFEQAVKLPAGSIIRAVSHFDNSAKNKFNPAPDQELPWGSQSWHEMYFPYMDLSIDKNILDLSKKTQGTN